jgi:hypothetical protein
MSKKLLLAFWRAGSLGLFPGVATGSPGTRDRSSPEFTFDVDLNVVLNADQIQTDTIMPKRSAHRFPRCRFPHPRRTIPTCRYHPSSVRTERCTGYTAIMPHRLAHRFASCRFPQPGSTIAARGDYWLLLLLIRGIESQSKTKGPCRPANLFLVNARSPYGVVN